MHDSKLTSKRFGLLALFAAAAVWLAAEAALAGIVVSPLKQEMTVKPGRAEKFYISISNNARNKWDKPQSVHLEVMDFTVNEAGGIVFEPAGTVKNSASKWITLSETDLTLAPGEGSRVECTIQPPYSAVGEAYSAVMVTLGTRGKTAAGVSVGYRTASGVFVTVAGRTFPAQAQITRCEVVWPTPATPPLATQPSTTRPSTTRPSTTQPDDAEKLTPPRVVAVIKNTGRVRFSASGELRINDAQGRIAFRGPMKTKRARVLPGDTRLFEAELTEALAPGAYTVRLELDYESKWAKARENLPLTISAEQAAVLAGLDREGSPAGRNETPDARIAVAPEELSEEIPPGGFRSLAVVATNTGPEALACTSAVDAGPERPEGASWITVAPERFILDPGRSRTLSVMVRVPSEAVGPLTASLVIEYPGTNGTNSRSLIPVRLAVEAGN